MSKMLKVSIVTAVLGLCACATEQAYESGRGWQRNQCNRIPDKTEAERCLSQVGMTYDMYKKQTGADSR